LNSSSGGELFIGGKNEALYQEDTTIAYTDVTQQSYCQIKMDEIQANGKTTITNKVDAAIIDTGANFIYGDRVKIYKLHQVLGGRGRSNLVGIPVIPDPHQDVQAWTDVAGFIPSFELWKRWLIPLPTYVACWSIGAPFL